MNDNEMVGKHRSHVTSSKLTRSDHALHSGGRSGWNELAKLQPEGYHEATRKGLFVLTNKNAPLLLIKGIQGEFIIA